MEFLDCMMSPPKCRRKKIKKSVKRNKLLTKSGRTFFNYNEETLKAAVDAVRNGMTVS